MGKGEVEGREAIFADGRRYRPHRQKWPSFPWILTLSSLPAMSRMRVISWFPTALLLALTCPVHAQTTRR